MGERCVKGRGPVRRELHYKRGFILLEHELSEKPCSDHGDRYAEKIEQHQYICRIFGEECAGNKHINRYPCAARHEWVYKYGYNPARAALYCTGRHYCRDIASEPHYKGDKRFAVQPYFMHKLVHNESGPCHISRILHKGDEQIQDQNIGQEDYDTARSSDDSVYNQVFQRSVAHHCGDSVTQCPHNGFQPCLRICPQCICGVKHQPHEQKEYRETEDFVSYNRIYNLAAFVLLFDPGYEGLLQRSRDKTVFLIGYGAFRILTQLFFYPFRSGIAHFCPFGIVFRLAENLIQLPVVFQKFYTPVSRREDFWKVDVVAFYFVGNECDFLLYCRRVFYMDVTDYFCNLIFGLFISGHTIAFIHCNNCVEQPVKTDFFLCHDRHHRNTYQLAQIRIIQFCTALFQLVIHIQGHDGFLVYIYQLGSKIKIPLQIRRYHRIQYDVGSLFHKKPPDIDLFGTVCGNCVCSR